MIKKNTASRLDKVRALLVVGERTAVPRSCRRSSCWGSRWVWGCAAVAAGQHQAAILKAGTSVTDMFSKITSGAA
ncbi:MAG: hypothetical protein ACLSVD_00855 [Eggerthellaceae bacterium]